MQDRLSPTISPSGILRALTRLSAVFGDPKRQPDQFKIMAAEWHRVLAPYGAGVVDQVIGRLIGTSKFFPALCEVREACETETQQLRRALRAPKIALPEPERVSPAENFERTPAEISERKIQIARIRERFSGWFSRAEKN